MSNGTYIQVILQGRLGADPEVRYDGAGNPITTLRIAVNTVRKDRNTNERIDETGWHRVVLFSKRAETAAQILKKGALVKFDGTLKNNEWTDKEGNKRVTPEILANEFMIISGPREDAGPKAMPEGRPAQRQAPAAQQRPAAQAAPAGGYDDMDGDIPF